MKTKCSHELIEWIMDGEPMSLDVYLSYLPQMPVDVFEANVTHNLGPMAAEAGIYKHLWSPEEIGIKEARQLIEPLRIAIVEMKADPERFKRLNPENGWGSYERFVPWLERYLAACEEYPNADVRVSR